MRTAAAPTTPGYRKRPGLEPLPGYRLLEPLGRGGFGEVWKCEAPGGLHKAIKFVADTNDPDDEQAEASLRQEFEAFERVKRIRHPFLLTLERVELAPGDLVMVMELADSQLQDRYNECAAEGLPGIPREELLGHICDAAEVLDFLAAKHGLQHLDIKPANLFLLSGRVKVGDFGLVRAHEITASTPGADRGLTPKYVAPEILHGRVDPRSDQYCLALVYQEMLTGRFPYPAKSPQQMMLQHVATAPDLAPLPEGDRAAVARALSKAPSDRFGSCTEFVRALLTAEASDTWTAQTGSQTQYDMPPVRKPVTGSALINPATRRPGLDPAQLTDRYTRSTGFGSGGTKLTTQARPATPQQVAPVEPMSEILTLLAAPAPARVRLKSVFSVIAAERLARHNDDEIMAPAAAAVIEVLVASVSPDGVVPAVAGGVVRCADGRWRAHVPFRPLPGIARLRLNVLKETWKAEIEERAPDLFVLRRAHAAAGRWGLSGKKAGVEVEMRFPPQGTPIGEAVLTARLYGDPDATLKASAEQFVPHMLEEARLTLQSAEERRGSVRVATQTPVTLYPVHGDGLVDSPIAASARDVSTGGLRVVARSRPETAYAYAVFDAIGPITQWALLVRLVRTTVEPNGVSLAGRFRADI